MKTETLREFIDLSSSLNYTATAKRFFISHSVLSRHIAALEEELGCKLLVRTSHFVNLTPEGEAFLPDARRIVKAHDDALAHMRQLLSKQNRVIRIGYLYESVCDFLLEGCKRFKQLNPTCELVFYSLTINDVAEALLNGDVDIALGVTLGELDSTAYGSRNLFEDELRAIVSKASPLAGKGVLTLADLRERTIIVRALSLDVGPGESSSPLQAFFDEAGLASNVVERAADATALSVALQMDDSAVTVMPSHMLGFFGDYFSMKPVEGMDISMFVSVYWKRENEDTALVALVDCLQDACDKARCH